MKLLIFTQYFWPEPFIINDLTRILAEQGHQVVVVTGKPNYPEGYVYDGYRIYGVQREYLYENVEVIRLPLLPRGKGGARELLLNYLSFVVSGCMLAPWQLKKRKFDAILVFAPSPIIQVFPAIILKWVKGAHLALWVQDLWPESLSATDHVRHPHLLKLVSWVVKGLYAGCDTLLVPSRAFEEPVARHASREKIVYYPNSIDVPPSAATVVEIPTDLIAVLEQSFSIVFAGNLGVAQSLETIVQAAILLKEHPGIRFVLVGSGSRLAWLQEQKKIHQLDNLLLPGRFSMSVMPQIFQRASVLLVSLKDEYIFAQTIPSKVQAYLAAGRPIIAALRGEGARVIVEAGSGMACDPDNPAALAEMIIEMKALPADRRQAMGRSGKAYFNEHFEMRHQVERLVEILDLKRKESD